MWGTKSVFTRNLLLASALGVLIAASGGVVAQPGTCPIGGYAIPACPVVTDHVIRDQVISRLSGSVSSAKYPVVVSVCNGVVTITGQVNTAGKRDLASIFAYGVKGVTAVRNQLTIDPNVVDDLILIGDVRRALSKSAIDAKRVKVDVVNGVVELTGIVVNEVDKENATQVAQSVPGVTAVYNSTTVYHDGNQSF